MLCDVTLREPAPPLLALIQDHPDERLTVQRLATGLYELNHFNLHHVVAEAHAYPVMEGPRNPDLEDWYHGSAVGVCDTPSQLFDHYPELLHSNRRFVVGVTPVHRDGPWKGWAWEKWEPYIGTQQPTAERLVDEPHIETVYCYAILELTDNDNSNGED